MKKIKIFLYLPARSAVHGPKTITQICPLSGAMFFYVNLPILGCVKSRKYVIFSMEYLQKFLEFYGQM